MLYDYRTAYPYARFSLTGGDTVTGQVMLFDTYHPAYSRMDRIETGAGYRRRIVAVTLTGGTVVPAWAYEAECEAIVRGLPVHPDGNWNNLS